MLQIKIRESLLTELIGLFFIAILILLPIQYISVIPIGYYDSSSGQCMGVEVEGLYESCDKFPKHHAVWATPDARYFTHLRK